MNKFLLFFVVLCNLLTLSYFYYLLYYEKQHSIHSELPLPCKEVTLERGHLMENISKRLKKRSGIQTVVLHGGRGVGKTTLARQYAKTQRCPVIWEINAESSVTINHSFEKLIYSMCKTKKLKNELKNISEDDDSLRRKKRLYLFFSKMARNYDNWLIIYDNVEDFQDIDQFYPYDPTFWGNGRIIITTRNALIKDNIFIPDQNIIEVPELTDIEKLVLFKNILKKNLVYTLEEKMTCENLLKNIPSFPLDVIIAAYYIKEKKLPFHEYSKFIKIRNDEFFQFQREFLESIGDYDQSRYRIISMSVDHLLNNKDTMTRMLLLLCLIDSENIPYDLITKYKDPCFIKQLDSMHKLALISFKDKKQKNISIHRNTQTVIRSILLNNYKKEEINEIVDDITNEFVKYLDNKLIGCGVLEVKLMINHIQKMLQHSKLISEKNVVLLKQIIGKYYIRIHVVEEANNIFHQLVVDHKKIYGKNSAVLAKSLVLLAQSMIGYEKNNKARKLLNRSYVIFKNSKEYNSLAESLMWLGVIERNLGNYAKSINFLKQAAKIYKNNGNDNDLYLTNIYLGSSYLFSGNYDKSLFLLQQSQGFFISRNGITHVRNACISNYLGRLYTKIKDYKKAEEFLTLSLNLHKSFYEDDNIKVGWSYESLAIFYNEKKNYKKAKEMAYQALNIYKSVKPKSHLSLSKIKKVLSRIHQNLGEVEIASNFKRESTNDLKYFYKK